MKKVFPSERWLLGEDRVTLGQPRIQIAQHCGSVHPYLLDFFLKKWSPTLLLFFLDWGYLKALV